MKFFSPKTTLKISAGLMTVLIASSLNSVVTNAVTLTNESPTNGNFSYEGNGSGYSNPNDMAKHLLIASGHGDVPNIRLGMYFNSGGQKTIRIVNAGLGDGGICTVHGSSARPLSGDFIRVRIWDPNKPSSEVIYNIRGSDVCNDQMGDNLPSTNNPKFYSTYQTPNPTVDPDTGMYHLNVVVSLIDINSLPDSQDNDQAISFKMIGPSNSLIGNIDTNQSNGTTPNNSTLAKRVGNPGGVTHRFGFALPCRVTQPSNQEVTLYDADNGLQGGGDVKFYVATIRDNGSENPLGASQYGARSRVTRDDIGSIVAFRPDPDTNVTSTVTIRNMDPTLKYVLVVKNVHSAGRPNLPSSSNFIYVGMPGDSIYGAENFTCPGWDATPNTTVNSASVTAGQTIKWTHTVRNKGDDTTVPINWEIKQTGVAASTITSPGPNPIPANSNGQILSDRVTSYKTKPADARKQVCQYIRIKPNALKSGQLTNVWEPSEKKCVLVVAPGSGNFDPTVKVDPDVVEPNENYDEDSMVSKGTIPYASELSRPRPTVQYQLGRVIYLPGSAAFSQPLSTTPPSCAFYGQPNPVYCNTSFRSGQVPAAKGVPYGVNAYTEPFPDNLPSGSKVCYTMAVEQPPTVETHQYLLYLPTGEVDKDGKKLYEWVSFSHRYYSDQGHPSHDGYPAIAAQPREWKYNTECVLVGKRPKVQIQGNDLRVRGESQTKVTRYTGSYYGSWVEYGAFTTQEDNAPASGAGYRYGSSSDVSSRLAWSGLTFANTNNDRPGTYGYFTAFPASSPLAAYYDDQTSDGSASWPGSLNGGKYHINGAVTVSGNNDNLTKARTTILYATGTVTINSNISYANDGYHSFDDIPQVIIVAPNINITSSVSRIDAWLVAYGSKSDKANGNINTCSDGPPVSERRSSACNSLLTVNGAVVANGLYLNRTGPTVSDPAAAAEIFRLRPDAYLWAAARQKSTGAARTVDIVELPPRF